jgi:hypothetical protein
MPAAYIDDGYTETELVPAQDGLYPAQTITFRPFTKGEIGQYISDLRRAGDDEDAVGKVAGKWLSQKLVSWDLRDSQNEVVKIAPDTVLRLHPRFFDACWGFIMRRLNVEKINGHDQAEGDLKN